MTIRRYSAAASMFGVLMLTAGCTNLKDRVTALETLTTTHTTQLEKIFAKESVVNQGKPLADAYTVLSTLSIPSGSYVLHAQVSGTANKQYPFGVGCRVLVRGSDGTVYSVAGGQAGLQAQAWAVHPLGTVNLPTDGVVEVSCRSGAPANEVQTGSTHLVAVGLPRVESTTEGQQATPPAAK